MLMACTAEPEAVPPDTDAPAPPPSEAPPTGPVFALALWPGEGIPEFDAATTRLPLRAAADPGAPVHDTLMVAAGSRVAYDSTRYVTITAAPIAVLRADTVTGRDFGSVTHLSRAAYTADVATVEVPVTPASRLELLQHRAEGTCFVRLGTRVIESDPCPLFDTGGFRPERDPATAWWVHVPGGAHGGGWVEVSDSTLRLAGRRF
jgi:hypothetical protein